MKGQVNKRKGQVAIDLSVKKRNLAWGIHMWGVHRVFVAAVLLAGLESQLPVQDVGYVHPGQMATVKLASADAVRFGSLEGEVTLVSPDAAEADDGTPYYKVRIETERDYFEHRSARYRLVPGVAVLCSIRTGSRSVLEYILDPFLGGVQSALRER